MTEQTPEQIAEKISDDLVERYGMDLGRLTRAIAAALTAERERARPPQGCVRLPDGRDVKVLGTLPLTKDGCVVGNHAELWIWDCEPIKLRADNIGATDVHGDDAFYEAGECYSTRAAAEAARGGGA